MNVTRRTPARNFLDKGQLVTSTERRRLHRATKIKVLEMAHRTLQMLRNDRGDVGDAERWSNELPAFLRPQAS